MGIDVGTSGLKVVVVDHNLHVLAWREQSYGFNAPYKGWAEQPPQIWVDAAVSAIRHIDWNLRQRVRGIGFTGQMHGVVVVDENGVPLNNALLWFDHRADMLARELEVVGPNGVAVDPTLPLAKIIWLRRNAAINWARARFIVGVKDWVRIQFGGSVLTDFSEASGTQMFDLEKKDWDRSLVALAGLEVNMLPRIVSSGVADGEISKQMADLIGIPLGCTLFVGSGDLSAAVGCLDLNEGDVFINLGTSGQVGMWGKPLKRQSVSRFADLQGQQELQLIPLLAIGMVTKWWSTIVGTKFFDFEPSHAEPPIVFLPYISGERGWNPHPLASGGFYGLRMGHRSEDLGQAVIEGVAMSIREAYDFLVQGHLRNQRVFLISSQQFGDFLKNDIAAVLGQPILMPRLVAPSAQGAARVAAHGTRGNDELVSTHSSDSIEMEGVEPLDLRIQRYRRLYPIFGYLRKAQWQVLSRNNGTRNSGNEVGMLLDDERGAAANN